ncbi:MAG TPA: divalent-cation tolerance protein CutA [Accumulibacter sp.]|nr:divalent-cation tolerance protein CutA [Accumulibacter sp.]HMW16492.1 divalent-cation tolerance protein CutA [Accumulibacter sp.]HMX22196.1 divalent-cation tolerance protein CutA [Accumulibacter sp.]HMY06252.1 divalent-cation tolerance protein CutA [Accumulibacter sp.]HNC16839.1 divalent-cation tolerance protein CutA [Accumulibacter sp.]
MTVLLVLTNLPDRASAEALAEELVGSRLAACVNILAGCRSVYRWQGAVESADEVPLLIKTCADRYPALETAIVSKHPYALPEVVALPVTSGLSAYLEWVLLETRPVD